VASSGDLSRGTAPSTATTVTRPRAAAPRNAGSVDRVKIARVLDREAAKAGRILGGLLEVNLGGEESKHGFAVADVESGLAELAALEHLRVDGLMAIPPPAPDPEEIAIARRAGQGAIEPAVFAKAMEYERAFVDAGGLLAAGVDPTGYGAAPPGLGDQRNFELLLEAGFSTEEVVQIMSANGAKVLGIDDEVGTVEAGKVADLVVIDADLERAGNLHATKIVFRHGVGWDTEKLIDSIRGLVGVR